MSKVAFFDFDGTITKSDSFLRFLFFKKQFNFIFSVKLVNAFLIWCLWKLYFYKNGEAKEKIFGLFFKGTTEVAFNDYCKDFAVEVLPFILRKEAMDKINWHKQQSHSIFIVSASVENYLSQFAEKNGIKSIGTKVEIINGKLTGKFSTPNCYGLEKVKRINETCELNDYEDSFAYGDSHGDKEMLELVSNSFYRRF